MDRRKFVRGMCLGGLATFAAPMVTLAQVPGRGKLVFVHSSDVKAPVRMVGNISPDRTEVPLVYDSGLDAYVLTDDGGATDAGMTVESDGTRVLTPGLSTSRIYRAGTGAARVI